MLYKEIREYVTAFAQAARNAVVGAGCDGVELHFAHGYLVDQFIQDVSNRRTDEYGGSIENRCRFALDIIDAVADAVGENKVAFRISPWSTYQDMDMDDPVPTFTYLVKEAVRRHPNLAYLHVPEPGVAGAQEIEVKEGQVRLKFYAFIHSEGSSVPPRQMIYYGIYGLHALSCPLVGLQERPR